MSLQFTPLLELIHKKFIACFSAITERVSLPEITLCQSYFVGTADYDPTTADSFLNELCLEHSSEFFQVFYLDINLSTVVKIIRLRPQESLEQATVRYFDEENVYNGIVEGSYFAIDNKQSWSIFYDALEDIFLLHIKDKNKLDIFRDYLLPN